MKKQPSKEHIIVCRPGFSEVLGRELESRFKITSEVVFPSAVSVAESVKLPEISETIFGRQVLPRAVRLAFSAPQECADFVIERLQILSKRDNRAESKWTLHSFAIDDDLALKAILKIQGLIKNHIQSKVPALHKRFVDAEDLASEDAPDPTTLVVQLWAANESTFFLSTATIANGVLPYAGGALRMKSIHGAPSRSSSKLSEALKFMQRQPIGGETGVDLGAAPGGWTFVMALHGVNMTAIDHGELELPKDKKLIGTVTHLKENGLKYLPPTLVDWLCCDMVMGAKQSLEVLENWIQENKMKHFIVNLKLPQDKPWPAVQEAIAMMSKYQPGGVWKLFQARHLYHDRSEITLIGSKEPVRKPNSGSKTHSKNRI